MKTIWHHFYKLVLRILHKYGCQFSWQGRGDPTLGWVHSLALFGGVTTGLGSGWVKSNSANVTKYDGFLVSNLYLKENVKSNDRGLADEKYKVQVKKKRYVSLWVMSRDISLLSVTHVTNVTLSHAPSHRYNHLSPSSLHSSDQALSLV